MNTFLLLNIFFKDHIKIFIIIIFTISVIISYEIFITIIASLFYPF